MLGRSPGDPQSWTIGEEESKGGEGVRGGVDARGGVLGFEHMADAVHDILEENSVDQEARLTETLGHNHTGKEESVLIFSRFSQYIDPFKVVLVGSAVVGSDFGEHVLFHDPRHGELQLRVYLRMLTCCCGFRKPCKG